MDLPNFDARKNCLDDPRDVQRDACGVGFIAHLKGQPSHQIVVDGLEILKRLDHRGGRAADGITSDGAGIQMHIPRSFLKSEARKTGLALPDDYALGMIFLPKADGAAREWLDLIEVLAGQRQYHLLWTRRVPVNSEILGPIARASEPAIYQIFFIDSSPKRGDSTWRLYLIRKDLEREAAARYGLKQHDLYVVSLSSETVCYKGLVKADDFAGYFVDLRDPDFKSGMSLVHQRFSTNTLPAWPLAQPFRMLCHNGEINTLRGNISAMNARTALLASDAHEDLEGVAPICVPGFSDSAMLDNALEFLLHSGRSLTEAITMLVPEPWERHHEMPHDLRDYYEYQSYRMEPWDGPAFVGFTDGRCIGAILDRNGLRPGRYWVTCDEHVIMASEAGVLDRRPEEIVLKGRLSPGRIFMVDMVAGAIVPDHTIKAELAAQQDYGQWLAVNRFELSEGDRLEDDHGENQRFQLMRAFGYSQEDLRLLLAPMANEGKEPVGSMGTDVPLAVLSEQRPLLYEYFKQLFAQVTNPPIDAIREELVTSLSSALGSETNLFQPSDKPVIRLTHPILLKADMVALQTQTRLRLVTLDLCLARNTDLASALAALTAKASEAVAKGAAILILNDLGVDALHAAIPALLACSAVHHSLIQKGLRARTSLVVSSGEPREVHHFALLFAYGASAIHPYLALELVQRGDETWGLVKKDPLQRARSYRQAIEAGILKVMSKMGISTLQSYRGAQIFEALGLSQAFVDQYFPWTPTRIEGVALDDVADDLWHRHGSAFDSDRGLLNDAGVYSWRRQGERHRHEPDGIAGLQKATRLNSRDEFKHISEKWDQGHLNLRSLLTFKQGREPIPLDAVDSVASIVRRFATGAMSFGSLSKETHETVAIAMNRIGAKSNSGEGGEDALRFQRLPSGDSKRSAIKQVASARFGVTSHYLVNADELQIKMAQGAKPGEGGQLPGDKVDSEIARIRHSTAGITLISPPPHHDIYSIEDLAQLIFDLKNANHTARVSVKLVSEVGVGTIAAGVAKAKADAILISGYEGGTGASPLSSIRHAGLPWELGLSETQRALVDNGLRGRVTLQVDGQLRTSRDIAIATLMGAEEWGIGTGALIVLGCVMMRKCHLNTCPVGIATQDPVLRARFAGQPEHLINYIFLLAEGLREIMAELGLRTVQEMVGRIDLLEKKTFEPGSRLDRIDVKALLAPAQGAGPLHKVEEQKHQVLESLDARDLIEASRRAFEGKSNVVISRNLKNTDRSVGTFLSSAISRQFGAQGLMGRSIYLNFKGVGGQSFMAFAVQGLKVKMEGEVNDYCGKGLSGAQVAVFPPSSLQGEQQVICGNVALYGATAGSLYVRGLAGERFAVRNSGAHAVVEGIGDHGCEYMTGGSVIVIGPIGRNFGAGMSGGLAFVYDRQRSAHKHINTEMLGLSRGLDEVDERFIWDQLQEHLRLTGSSNAHRILARWSQEKDHFLSIVPSTYGVLRKNLAKPQRKNREMEQGGLHG